jgi:adenine-specific DNA-methyltransferase
VGNLLLACKALCPTAKLIGIEREESTIAQAERSAPEGTRLLLGDYMKCRLEPVQAIIANPPYVKAHHLDYTEDEWRFFESVLGLSLDRLSNLYALFILKIWHDLLPGGRAAVIVPAEFLNANFGEPLKQWILQVMRPAGIAVFDPSFSVFENALTTSCIFFVQKGANDAPVLVCRAGGIGDVERFLEHLCSGSPVAPAGLPCWDASEWDPSEKWLNRILGLRRDNLDGTPLKIGDYFRSSRGIATGANEFFVLPMKEIERRKMLLRDFSPCVARSSYARGLVFSVADFNALKESGKRCLLLNPAGPPGPAMERYLDEGRRQGISNRHLPSHRPVWYAPENRPAADVWVGVFSREQLKCILNAARVKNLTCFHALYARDARPGLPELVTIFLNSTIGKAAFHQVNRFYGDGLYKLEPKDVEAIPCPELPGLTEREAEWLREEMARIGSFAATERIEVIDRLARRLFGSVGEQARQGSGVELDMAS